MIRKVLIPNRGEIAVRIIKAAHELGIKTIVTLSELEKDTIPAQISDEVHYFSDGPLNENYLHINHIVQLAQRYGADSIHPGYGFLSENYNLVQACSDSGITFIGPSANNLKQMGDKQMARTIARQCEVPLTPSWEGSTEDILAQSKEMQFPVLIKAAMGGGGKGMVICQNIKELEEQLPAVARQAENYFGDGRVYAERYIESPRHIEVQVLADEYGNTIHLYERECSVQRRFQKIIEEAPAPKISEGKRSEITNDAVKLCKAIDYKSAGTIEFLLDKDGKHYFLEMNTRIQVEHGVTEEITGVDLVKWQFNIANGNKLTLAQEDISINGHAIEARIYAEDPENNFRPSPGEITDVVLPSNQGIRMEMAFNQPTIVHPQFDPMIAKFIVHHSSRNQAIKELSNKLSETIFLGIRTNLAFLQSILKHPTFKGGEVQTHFCQSEYKALITKDQNLNEMATLAYALLRFNPDKGIDGYWRLHPYIDFQNNDERLTASLKRKNNDLIVNINNTNYKVSELNITANKLTFNTNNQKIATYYFDKNENYTIIINNHQYNMVAHDILPAYSPENKTNQPLNGTALHSPLPGQVSKILVKKGQKVKEGDVLVIVEAMKMENHLSAWKDTLIEQIHVEDGDKVKSNQLLITTN